MYSYWQYRCTVLVPPVVYYSKLTVTSTVQVRYAVLSTLLYSTVVRIPVSTDMYVYRTQYVRTSTVHTRTVPNEYCSRMLLLWSKKQLCSVCPNISESKRRPHPHFSFDHSLTVSYLFRKSHSPPEKPS